MSDPVTAYVAKGAVTAARRWVLPLLLTLAVLVGFGFLALLDSGGSVAHLAAGDDALCGPQTPPTTTPASQPPTTPATSPAADPAAVVAANAAKGAGFISEDLVIAVAVAGAESGWDPDAVGGPNPNGTFDYGLWQINSVHEELLEGGDRFDPAYNAYMAAMIWIDAAGWSPWTTYRSGAYLAYMDEARAAVAASGPGGPCGPGLGPISGDLAERAQIIADAIRAGEPEPFFGNTEYWRMCARLAANIFGHAHSGYATAMTQWNHYVMQGQAHYDANPPPGVLLFYDSGSYAGHVATFLGGPDRATVTNDIHDGQSGLHGGVYITTFDDVVDGTWHLDYLGWAEGVYPGDSA